MGHDKPTGQNGTKGNKRPRAGDKGPKVTIAKIEHQERKAREAEASEFERRRAADLAKAALELDPLDLKILQLSLNFPSATQEQIGAIAGLSRKQVNLRMCAPKFRRAVEIAKRTAIEVFQNNQAKAARVLGDCLDSKDERIKIRAAIAHMWPHIHADAGKGDGKGDFVSFIQEAYEAAEAERLAKGATS